VSTTARQLADYLARYRFHFADEDQLQAALAGALASRYPVEREVPLLGLGRIDLMVERVGIEVKIQGATADVQRQLRRYCESALVEELLVVTTRLRHTQLVPVTSEFPKPVVVLPLGIGGI